MVKAIRTMNKTAGTIDVDIPTDMWDVNNPDGGVGFELGKMSDQPHTIKTDVSAKAGLQRKESLKNGITQAQIQQMMKQKLQQQMMGKGANPTPGQIGIAPAQAMQGLVRNGSIAGSPAKAGIVRKQSLTQQQLLDR